MDLIGIVALLVLLIGGYSIYLRLRERELEKKMARLGDNKELIVAEMDDFIAQTAKEAEFFKRNGGKL